MRDKLFIFTLSPFFFAKVEAQKWKGKWKNKWQSSNKLASSSKAATTTTTTFPQTTTTTTNSFSNCELSDESLKAVSFCSPSSFGVNIHSCVFADLNMAPGDVFFAGADGLTTLADGASANNTCKGTLSDNGEHYNFLINGEIRDCGTEVSSNGTHISFSNSIRGTAGEIIGKITRQRVMNVQFECQFDQVQKVHLSEPIAANLFQVTLDNGEDLAEFEVSFGIYEDQTFSSFLATNATTNVPNDIFLGVSLDDSPPGYAIQIEECWATPRYDHGEANNAKRSFASKIIICNIFFVQINNFQRG
ncbi:unnamed protein product [Oikopleura dioica]|uniref:ZP domain-containing protein n=1 Tax=Oikopleura dioica TaxID=34765 RepID=E4Y6S7_OIKDI|nr:unnamed protein product [Oikopleura dioica]